MSQRTAIPGPDWLGPHLDDLLDSQPGTVRHGRIDAVSSLRDDVPSSILSASYAGLVHTDFVTDSRDNVEVYVTFYPWSSIARVRYFRETVQAWPANDTGNRPPPSVHFEETEDRTDEENARAFAASLTRMMRGAR